MSNYNISDPLAQSFFIDTPCIVTKADLFFSAKDNSIPCFVQIRKNQTGVPGPYIIPFSSVILYPNSVNTSSNANVATSVNFTSPIYLEAGEYSLTLGSASKNYRVWVSELDSLDIVSNKRITEQPYVGSLYKGQNASTYTPIQTQDLKFNLYRANFNTALTGSVDFVLDQSNTEPLIRLLEEDPLEVFPSSDVMRVYHENHGFETGSYVRLNGLSNTAAFGNITFIHNFFGIDANNIENIALTVSNVTQSSYTVILSQTSTANVPTRFGGPSVSAHENLNFDMIYPVVSAIKQKGTVTPSFKATSKSYSVDSSYDTLIETDYELEETRIIASDVNRQFNMSNAASFFYRLNLTTNDNLVAPLVDKKQLGLVFTTNLIDSPDYDSVTLLPWDEVTIGNSANANVHAIFGNIGLINFADASEISNSKAIVKGTRLTITGNNPNNGTFRVVDVLDSGANVKVFALSSTFNQIIADANVQNTYSVVNGTKFIFEEAAEGGSVFSKYITRQIDFLNPSTSINLRLDVSKPGDASVEFYFKTKLVGETEILSSKEFTQMTDVTVPTSLSGEFYEVQKQIDSLEPFNSLVLKVVFKSTNSAQIPKITNLRAIVLE